MTNFVKNGDEEKGKNFNNNGYNKNSELNFKMADLMESANFSPNLAYFFLPFHVVFRHIVISMNRYIKRSKKAHMPYKVMENGFNLTNK